MPTHTNRHRPAQALNVLYPDCTHAITAMPVCYKIPHNIGWVRLGVWVLGPTLIAVLFVVVLSSYLKHHQQGQLEQVRNLKQQRSKELDSARGHVQDARQAHRRLSIQLDNQERNMQEKIQKEARRLSVVMYNERVTKASIESAASAGAGADADGKSAGADGEVPRLHLEDLEEDSSSSAQTGGLWHKLGILASFATFTPRRTTGVERGSSLRATSSRRSYNPALKSPDDGLALSVVEDADEEEGAGSPTTAKLAKEGALERARGILARPVLSKIESEPMLRRISTSESDEHTATKDLSKASASSGDEINLGIDEVVDSPRSESTNKRRQTIPPPPANPPATPLESLAEDSAADSAQLEKMEADRASVASMGSVPGSLRGSVGSGDRSESCRSTLGV